MARIVGQSAERQIPSGGFCSPRSLCVRVFRVGTSLELGSNPKSASFGGLVGLPPALFSASSSLSSILLRSCTTNSICTVLKSLLLIAVRGTRDYRVQKLLHIPCIPAILTYLRFCQAAPPLYGTLGIPRKVENAKENTTVETAESTRMTLEFPKRCDNAAYGSASHLFRFQSSLPLRRINDHLSRPIEHCEMMD